MARQNNYPTFVNNSTLITAEFLNGLVDNVKTLNSEDGVFDISMANAVSDVPTKYSDLSSALSGNNVPVDVRKGGMSVKFINAENNEYEQWSLKGTTWSTNASNWGCTQKIDSSEVKHEDGNVKDVLSYIDKSEYIYAIIDNNDRFILGIKPNGSIFFGAGIPEQIESALTEVSMDLTVSDKHIEQNGKYLQVLMDSDQRVIESLDVEGKRFIASLESPVLDSLQSQIDLISDNNKTIVCWGDSLTAGAGSGNLTNTQPVISTLVGMGFTNVWSSLTQITYETMLSTLLPDNYTVINCGVGGETLHTIASRQGAEPMYLGSDIILPSDATQKVAISNTGDALYSMHTREKSCKPLIQGEGNSVNPVYVEGIKCTLSVVKNGYEPVNYYLQRQTSGNRNITIPSGTPIITKGSREYRNADIAILWCWQNGGYNSNDDLVAQLKKIIGNLTSQKYLIIGLHSGTASNRSAQESLLETTFGDKFFNWRRYVSTNALSDWGFTPTEDDNTAMTTGSIPPTFLTDSVHLKASGYMILGYKMWERMTQLGYFD